MLLIAAEQRSAFAGDDVLGFVEAECAQVADRPERAPLVRRHDPLCGVLHHSQAVAVGDRQDFIHFA